MLSRNRRQHLIYENDSVQFTSSRGNIYTGRVERIVTVRGQLVAKVAYAIGGVGFLYTATDGELVKVKGE